MIIVDLEQGTPEWFKEKLGKPSASNCSKLINDDGKPSKQSEGYLFELASERITGSVFDSYKSAFMEAGQEREQEARDLFEILYRVEVKKTGVIYKDEKKEILCSPDGLIKNTEGIEIKNPIPKTQAKYLLNNCLPSEYFGQVQFSLYVTGFKCWHFFSYVPKMKPFYVEVLRDEKFIKSLDTEVKLFCMKLDEVTEKIR